MQEPQDKTLVFYALAQEAKPFRRVARRIDRVQLVISGMGPHNARAAAQRVLATGAPELLVTAGLAGALAPELRSGTVLFEAEATLPIVPDLLAAGARPGRFYSADKVIATAAEKLALRHATQADAVEMESGPIRDCCRQRGIACVIVRVILDEAGEDLPVDFNCFLNRRQDLNYLKLAWAAMRSPAVMQGLLRLRRRSLAASRRLAQVLARLTSG